MLDKSMSLVRSVLEEPLALAGLVEATGISRPTAHRLASALVDQGLLRRTDDGRFALGAELVALGRAAAAGWPWGEAAGPALSTLVAATGESAQLYVREGDVRRCLLSLESAHELRTIVPEGAVLSMEVGSAARALRDPAAVGRRGWVASVEERAPGVASVSAPIRDATGLAIAAIGVSGPVERLGRDPGRRHGEAVVAAARTVEVALR